MFFCVVFVDSSPRSGGMSPGDSDLSSSSMSRRREGPKLRPYRLVPHPLIHTLSTLSISRISVAWLFDLFYTDPREVERCTTQKLTTRWQTVSPPWRAPIQVGQDQVKGRHPRNYYIYHTCPWQGNLTFFFTYNTFKYYLFSKDIQNSKTISD